MDYSCGLLLCWAGVGSGSGTYGFRAACEGEHHGWPGLIVCAAGSRMWDAGAGLVRQGQGGLVLAGWWHPAADAEKLPMVLLGVVLCRIGWCLCLALHSRGCVQSVCCGVCKFYALGRCCEWVRCTGASHACVQGLLADWCTGVFYHAALCLVQCCQLGGLRADYSAAAASRAALACA